MNFKTISLEQKVFQFLDTHYNVSCSVLLGLSGGPDSLALFHVLIKYSKLKSFKFGVAHIDHGWRVESAQEAKELESLMNKFSIPFHLKRLTPSQLIGNLEAACREERIKYFNSLCEEYGYQAVLLGHHADDQAETVLKRLFEGASMTAFSGLQSVSKIGTLNIWRPLLGVSKNAILDWLQADQIIPFSDYTNLDPKFLRARFRTQIIPDLSQQFGKEIANNLWHIGQESQELSEFLNEVLGDSLRKIEVGKLGVFLDLTEEDIQSAFAIKYIIKQFGIKGGCLLSRQMIQDAYQCVVTGKGNRILECQGYCLFIDRKRIFLTKKIPKIPSEKIPLALGSFQYGDWNIQVTESEKRCDVFSGWKHVWNGALSISLPKDVYYFAPPSLQASFPRTSSISKWWTNEKIPAFIRYCVPVVWKENTITHEFLAHRQEKRCQEENGYLNISLRIKDTNDFKDGKDIGP